MEAVRDDVSWFESQIEERREADQKLLEEAFFNVSGAVLGHRMAEKIHEAQFITKNAIEEILKYYHCKPVEIPDTLKTAEEQLDYSLRPYGLMRRSVELTQGWYRNTYGPILAFTKDRGLPVALMPGTLSGYTYFDAAAGRRKKINEAAAALFETEALCFYRPLPQKKLGIPDLLLYMKRCASLSDIILLVAATFAVTLVGMAIPQITRFLTGPVLKSGRAGALIGISIALICISLSSQLLTSTRELIQERLNTRAGLGVQAAMIMRLMSLPASFFRKYSAGELKSRSMSVNQLCSLLLGMVMSTGLTSLSSLLYITQIFSFAPDLLFPSLMIILVTVGFSIFTTLSYIRINRRQMEVDAKESGMSYSLITGVQKIKLAGAEKRVFAKWMNLFSEGAELAYNPPLFIKINTVISTAISLLSNILLYYLAVKSRMEPSAYFAFTASYGMVMGAFMSMSGIALSAAQIRPILEMAEPFLKAEPETAEGKEIVTRISGGIELDHVSFRYSRDTRYVLDNLSLKIRPGEYVAIVGKTGCGKSTLVRLLLGFEKPEKGAIYYDGKDIDSLDIPSLRKKIGTVMQDAGLFQGDIYSNIVITAPELTVDEAWEAAEKAGIADDIRAMPMGMYTLIAEGQGGISGGQRQRIMIARAIAPKPKLLIFDEATSALDNRTQRQVSEALDSMGCTRVVIAHRLSTIRHCDRILVLDGGRIVEDGTYEELIEKHGFFAELVERQRLVYNTDGEKEEEP
ncbi:MAG: NHLP bacteriocin export ABC transporter permease/ATPase subunit [Eubacteriales bacterium]|nr:NHLP bacteriocin export ABC transporter permease/ATPase subunit [Eubacteriales bacterium]